MPTRIFEVSAAPVNLLAANDLEGNPLDLQVGTTYSGRYVAVGPQSILKMVEAPTGTVVTAGDPALPVRVYEDLTIIPKTGMAIFAWSENHSSQLIINSTS